MMQGPDETPRIESMLRTSREHLVMGAVQLVCGIALFGGRRAFASMWRRLRTYTPATAAED